jgi:hypothetical protein
MPLTAARRPTASSIICWVVAVPPTTASRPSMRTAAQSSWSAASAAAERVSRSVAMGALVIASARAVPPTTVTMPGTSHLRNVPAILPPNSAARFGGAAIADAEAQ